VSDTKNAQGSFDKGVFRNVWVAYKKLNRGEQAAIRKVRTPEELRSVPCVPTILPDDAFSGGAIKEGWLRVVFILPFVSHRHAEYGNIHSIGAAMSKAGVTSGRMRRCVSGRSPIDMESMRKILKHLQSNGKDEFDMKHLGTLLYVWNDSVREQLAEGFYVSEVTEKKKREKAHVVGE